MIYTGKNQGCNDNDGWLCLHESENKNENIEIIIVRSKSYLDELRKALGVPKIFSDEKLLEVLTNDITDRYLSVEYFTPEDVQNLLTDKIEERWL